MLRLRTPLATTFSPLVPLASSGRRGVFSQTSTPWTRWRAIRMSYPSRKKIFPRNRSSLQTAMTFLIRSFPILSFGCALPAKTMWTGRVGWFRIRSSRSRFGEDHVRPLVGGEPPGEADHERRRVELCKELLLPGLRIAVLHPVPGEVVPEEVDHLLLQFIPGSPQFGFGDVLDARPPFRIGDVAVPVHAEVGVQQRSSSGGRCRRGRGRRW